MSAPDNGLFFVFDRDDMRDFDVCIKQYHPDHLMLFIEVDQTLSFHDVHGSHVASLVMDNLERVEVASQCRMQRFRQHRRSRTQQDQNQGEFEHDRSPGDVSDNLLRKAVVRREADIERSHHAVAPASETATYRQFQRTGGT